jgi:hypothetical protein
LGSACCADPAPDCRKTRANADPSAAANRTRDQLIRRRDHTSSRRLSPFIAQQGHRYWPLLPNYLKENDQ